MSATKEKALKAYDQFLAHYSAKYPGAVKCLEKDKEQLFAFYDFPAEHWQHIRTTNPIESTFATVRQPDGDADDGLQIRDDGRKRMETVERI